MTSDCNTTARHSSPATRRRILVPAVITVVIVAATLWIGRVLTRENSVLNDLRLRDAGVRKRAAWRVTGGGYPKAASLIHRLLSDRGIAEADVRESHVYALGQLGDASNFDLLGDLLVNDQSGFVRQAAWLAAARSDPDRCRALLNLPAMRTETWDRIGAAQARLQLRDARGVDELLRFAAQGDPGQRTVAGRALYRTLAPAMTAAGRWPLDASANPDGSWPRELVEQVERRLRRLDLHSLMNNMWIHVQRSDGIIRAKARLAGARDRIAGILFSR